MEENTVIDSPTNTHTGVWNSRCPSHPLTAIPHLILPEVGDRRQISMQSLPTEPAVTEFSYCPLSILFRPEVGQVW